MPDLPPLSLYVHIPWCERKCPYCDFNSHRVPSRENHARNGLSLEDDAKLPESPYLAALRADLLADSALVAGRRISSVFIGGGTPSLLSIAAIGAILQIADDIVGLDTAAEITMEANPGSAERKRFRGYRSAGVNRLSIGVQSFNDSQLGRLGRIHSSREATRAVTMARHSGFENINIDLMYGLPGQIPAEAGEDLKHALNLAPQHLSWYQLTIEPNTEFYSRPPTLPDDEQIFDMQSAGEQVLSAAGYQKYEISAWARPGWRSVHNLNYWRFGDYLGIGAGAHAKITNPDSGQILRLQKTRMPANYLDPEKAFVAQRRTLGSNDLVPEFMMNALRLSDGVPADLYTDRTGRPIEEILDRLSDLRARGLLVRDPDRIQTTSLGARFLNNVLAELMPD